MTADVKNLTGECDVLLSCFIISYNNVHYLNQAVKSILEQTLDHIELVISDDASQGIGVEDIAFEVCLAAKEILLEKELGLYENTVHRPWFEDEGNKRQEKKKNEALLRWKKENILNYQSLAAELIEKNFPNIVSFKVNCNIENKGTVKHLKDLKKNAQGKYIAFLAADDKLHDKLVLEDMITHFESLPEDAYVLSSQCGMYDVNLEKLMYYAVNDELKKIITMSSSKELFGELADWCIIPAAGTIYKKKVFDIYGDLDDRYHLIEDWTYFLKLARSGAKIYYYDRLTYMHRDGGISHGNNVGGNKAHKYYLEDSILLTQQEILPYIHDITPEQRKRSLKRYKNTCRGYTRLYEFPKMNLVNKLKFIVKNAPYYLRKICIGVLEFIYYRIGLAIKTSVSMLFFAFLISWSKNPTEITQLLSQVLGLCGTISLCASGVVVVIYRGAKYIRNYLLLRLKGSI